MKKSGIGFALVLFGLMAVESVFKSEPVSYRMDQ